MAKKPVNVETLKHDKASRRNIPTAEYQSLAERQEEMSPLVPVNYKRARPLPEGETRERDQDLDPQIIWRGARIRVRIPTKPAMHSKTKPATCSDLKPAGVPI